MENQEQQRPGITLNDIGGAAQIIDLAVSRGAFRASEAEQVGVLYNRLVNFLKENQSAQQANVAEGETAPSEEASSE
jgi:hypothetical protein